jgi:hypothetical protein
MSLRRTLFWVSLGLIPALVWNLRVMPLQQRRQNALLEQENSGIQQAKNVLALQERDELQKQWMEFKPQAELEMVSLGNNMNPILLQNRVIDLARRLECELRIEESSNRTQTDGAPTFSFSGSGQPLQVYDFLRYLERGDSRARFLDLAVAQRKNSRNSGITAHFSGTFTIPEIPAPQNFGILETKESVSGPSAGGTSVSAQQKAKTKVGGAS